MSRAELEAKVLILMGCGATKDIASLIVDLVWAARREGHSPILNYAVTPIELAPNSVSTRKIGSPSALPLRSVSDPIRSESSLPGLEADPERAHVSQQRRRYNATPRPDGFDAFWALYPRHEAKQAAMKAWSKLDQSKLDLSNTESNGILDAIRIQRIGLIQRGLEYCPLPATWLNGKRWEDERPIAAAKPVARNFTQEANDQVRLQYLQQVAAMEGK